MIATQLERLRIGEISFDVFYKTTRREWASMAVGLLRRWSTTAALEVDDLVQVMLAAVPGLIERWDSERADLGKFVVYNSMSIAKRLINADRGSLRRSGKAPSRAAIAFSSMGSRDAQVDESIFPSMHQGPVAIEMVEKIWDAMQLVRSAKERAIMEALTQTQCYDAAAELLAVKNGWSPEWARLSVSRTGRKFAKRAGCTSGVDNSRIEKGAMKHATN